MPRSAIPFGTWPGCLPFSGQSSVIGEAETRELGGLAGRLIGLQYFPETAAMVGAEDADVEAAARYLARMFGGMGDSVSVTEEGEAAVVKQSGLRIVRGLEPKEASLVLDCWAELWQGTVNSQRALKTLEWAREGDQICWTVAPRGA